MAAQAKHSSQYNTHAFFSCFFPPQEVWAQTTGVTRTKMSMQMVLAGLFPPRGTGLEWSRRLNWQPIPIFSEPLEEDTVRPAEYDLPKL